MPKLKSKQAKLKQKISELCLPLTRIKSIKGILLYGSSVKKGIRKGHDIDVLVIYDDTIEEAESELKKIKFLIDLITLKAEKQDLILHFQPPKPLSLWWKLIRNAEPWAISALKNSIILHDPNELLKVLKKLIAKGKLYAIDEKAEKLMTRAIESFIEVRETLMKATWILLKTMTTASQIMLSYLGIFTSSANETRDALIKHKKELMLKDIFIEWYDELIKVNEKIAKGTLSEFRASEIDLWRKRVQAYIKESEDILIYLDKKIREKEIKESYEAIIKLCDKALALKIKKLPKDEKRKIELFKKYFIDTKKIEKRHYEVLQELYNYVRRKKPIKRLIDKVYIKTLEAAIDEIAMRK